MRARKQAPDGNIYLFPPAICGFCRRPVFPWLRTKTSIEEIHFARLKCVIFHTTWSQIVRTAPFFLFFACYLAARSRCIDTHGVTTVLTVPGDIRWGLLLVSIGGGKFRRFSFDKQVVNVMKCCNLAAFQQNLSVFVEVVVKLRSK